MKCYFRKMPDGALVADNDETSDWLRSIKSGAILGGDFPDGDDEKIHRPRNYLFLKKTMCLFRVCFDYFTENHEWNQTYKGIAIEPSFEMFRKNLTILAGHYTATYDIRGDVRLEAKSLSFAKCTEEEAGQIYSDVINAALKQVYSLSMTEDQLRKLVDEILRFS